MTRWQGWTWDMGNVTGSDKDESGTPIVQVDNYGAGSAHHALHSPYGFASRPLDPVGQNACLALYAYEGDKGHAWPLDDPRVTAKLPPLKRGGSQQYGATGTFDLIDGENGTKTIYVPYSFNGDVPAKAMLVAVDVTTTGKEQIQIIHGDGMAITMIAGGKHSTVIKNKAGDAYIEINDDGIILNGNIKVMGGASIGVNALAGDLTQPLVNETTLLAWFNAVVIPILASASPAKVIPPLVPGVVGTQFAKGL